jgi:RNA polymerase sigma factor (sigma-70 family)
VSEDRQRQDLELTFAENRVRLLQAAQRIVGTPDLAEDVLQSAYLRILDVSSRLTIDQPISYCFQVVRHLAIDHRRRMMLEAQLFTVETLGDSVVASGASPEQSAISGEYLALVEQVLARLPERTRRAFHLYRVEGLTQRQIAAQMTVSATLVNFMIRDAIDALKQCRRLSEPWMEAS